MRMSWRVFVPAWTPPEMHYEFSQMKADGVDAFLIHTTFGESSVKNFGQYEPTQVHDRIPWHVINSDLHGVPSRRQ